MGAVYSNNYPSSDTFGDLLGLESNPKRWSMRITPDQLDQMVHDLESIGCKIIDRPTETDLAIYIETFRHAQERDEKEKTEAARRTEELGSIPAWPSAFSAVWPQGARWNGKIYGKSGSYSVYFSGKQVSISDELKEEVEAAQAARIEWNEKNERIKRS